LGYTSSYSAVSGFAIAGGYTSTYPFSVPTNGVWLVTLTLKLTNTSTITIANLQFGLTLATGGWTFPTQYPCYDQRCGCVVNPTASAPMYTMSYTFSFNTSIWNTTAFIKTYSSAATNPGSYLYVDYVRIG
jgi:hypothetical protein